MSEKLDLDEIEARAGQDGEDTIQLVNELRSVYYKLERANNSLEEANYEIDRLRRELEELREQKEDRSNCLQNAEVDAAS